MPKLPQSQGLVVARPFGQVVPGMRDPVARSSVEVGSDLFSAANQMESAFRRLDKLDVEDKYNQAVMYADELALNYKQEKGGNAVNGDLKQTYLDQFDSYIDSVEFKNDKRRKMFKDRAAVLRNAVSGDITKHVMKESETYSKDVYDSTIETSITNAALHKDQPGFLALSQLRINDAIETYADTKGKSRDWIAAQKRQYGSDLIENVSIAVLGEDPYKARDMLSKPIDGLNEDRRLVLLRQSNTEISRREAEYKKNQELFQAKNERDIALEAMQGKLRPAELVEALDKEQISPAFAMKMEKRAYHAGPAYDDQLAVLEYKYDPLAFTELELLMDPRLTVARKEALLDERRRFEEDESNWRRSQNGQEAVRMIEQKYGVVKGIMAQLDPERAQRMNVALTELYDRVEALPLRERALSARGVARDIISELEKGDNSERIKYLEERKREEVPYSSVEEVMRQFDADKEKGWFGGMGEEEKNTWINILEEYDAEIRELRNGTQ